MKPVPLAEASPAKEKSKKDKGLTSHRGGKKKVKKAGDESQRGASPRPSEEAQAAAPASFLSRLAMFE